MGFKHEPLAVERLRLYIEISDYRLRKRGFFAFMR